MEMPFDVISNHLLNGFDEPLEPDNAREHAMDIDQELQKKFIFISMEEIDAIKIESSSYPHGLVAGSGPETIRATVGDNSNWLYNSAIHALAMYQHLKYLEERAKIEAEQAKLARRPEPGVYLAHLEDEEDEDYFTIIVDDKRLIWVPQVGGGMLNLADDYDSRLAGNGSRWIVQSINLSDGTITK